MKVSIFLLSLNPTQNYKIEDDLIMSVKIVKDYYMKNKAKLIAQFDKFLHISNDILLQRFNEPELEGIFNKMRKEYENLIPEIPYIGGRKNPFTSMLVDSVAMLASFRILEQMGMTNREIGLPIIYKNLRWNYNTNNIAVGLLYE